VEKTLTKLNELMKQHKTLLLVLPWFLYAFYLIVWAAPQYESQSQLIVKSSDGGCRQAWGQVGLATRVSW